MRASVGRVGKVGGLGGSNPFTWANAITPAYAAFDFQNDRAIWDSARVANLAAVPNWTFTRASTGYALDLAGNLVSFASGALRRTDRGVLIEGARTNLCLQSQTFDNASWAKNLCTITADAVAAPDGTLTADKLICASGASFLPNVNQAPTLADSTAYTASCFMKAGEFSWGAIIIRSKDSATETAAYFNLATGALGSVGSGVTSTITALANGWFFCTATKNSGAGATSPRFRVMVTTADNTDTPTGDGTSGIYIWGAQLEAASFASSYIPTTTASVTRAADALSITGATLTGPLTIYGQWQKLGDDGATFSRVFEIEGSTSDYIAVYHRHTTNIVRAFVRTASVDVADQLIGTAAIGTTQTVCARFETNNVAGSLNGAATGATDTSAALAAGFTVVRFGQSSVGTSVLFGYISRIAIWNSAFTDAQLQTQTT